MIFIIAIAAFLATFLGGLFALRFKDRLHLILGFSAGAVLGVVFFDLLPEAVNLSQHAFPFLAIGFVVYMLLDRFVVMHSHHDDHEEHHQKRGFLGAGSLSVHSFLDGVAIGLAFQVSAAVGAVVTLAVLVHDFSDGINTVSMILKNGGNKKTAFQFLVIDAIAPVVGIMVTLFFMLPENILGIILALFAGFFLYIGASDLIPESHHNHPTVWTTVMTVIGIAVLYGVIKLAMV
jgi:ZIP family zinc transporter